jgi:Tfp pilus assembly protein PilP
MRPVLILAACLALSGCGFGADGPTVIDGSTPEAFSQTLAAAKRDLGPRDRLKFEAALAEYKARTFAKADSREEFNARYREGLDGLTAPRVVAQFNKDVDRLGGKAADTAFDVKRTITGKTAP